MSQEQHVILTTSASLNSRVNTRQECYENHEINTRLEDEVYIPLRLGGAIATKDH